MQSHAAQKKPYMASLAASGHQSLWAAAEVPWELAACCPTHKAYKNQRPHNTDGHVRFGKEKERKILVKYFDDHG